LHRDADSNALPEIVCAEDLLAAEMATPRELLSGLLHQGSKLIVGGSSKSYKTWVLTDLAVAVASGTPWLGFDTTAGKVLYVNLEIQPAFFRRRVAEIVNAKHEEEGAFTVEMVLRNLPPVDPFVVKWQFPLFQRENSLDPARLKQAGGRPAKHTPEMLLECLGNQRLTSGEWEKLCTEETEVTHGRFFELLKALKKAGKVQKSAIDRKWEKIGSKSGNYEPYKDQ
jgi:hypothetical protein